MQSTHGFWQKVYYTHSFWGNSYFCLRFTLTGPKVEMHLQSYIPNDSLTTNERITNDHGCVNWQKINDN